MSIEEGAENEEESKNESQIAIDQRIRRDSDLCGSTQTG